VRPQLLGEVGQRTARPSGVDAIYLVQRLAGHSTSGVDVTETKMRLG
jgi:hypothetical protein